MDSLSGTDVLYAVFFIGLIGASWLDQLGLFASSSVAAEAKAKVSAKLHASPTPAIPSVSPADISWLVSWPAMVFVLIIAGLIIVVVFNYIFANMKEENEKRSIALEMKLDRHDEWIENQTWREGRLDQHADTIRTLQAELESHRKMLKVLKHMPSYQIEAATMAVTAAVSDPKAAREMTKAVSNTAQTQPAWEQENEVTDEN